MPNQSRAFIAALSRYLKGGDKRTLPVGPGDFLGHRTGPGRRTLHTLHRGNRNRLGHLPWCGGEQEIERRKARGSA